MDHRGRRIIKKIKSQNRKRKRKETEERSTNRYVKKASKTEEEEIRAVRATIPRKSPRV